MTPAEKQKAIRQYINGEKSINEIAEEHGLSRSYAWKLVAGKKKEA
jgi:transposase-like protein